MLEKSIAELIAAGEVIERPSSIVKELIENAVDANATEITVEIKGGGVGYIRVTDNGNGIGSEDIQNAFLRHATSKVLNVNDLDSIGTLGFRGEALCSIAAVSKVELITKTEEALDGWSYKINGGEELAAPTPTGAPDGTTFIIRDIFYNTPARMKFLRSDVAEGNTVAQIVDKTALAHPEIAFAFIRDGKIRLQTSGNNDLLAVIARVYDRDFAKSMIKVDYRFENRVSVTGYVGNPQFSKPSRNYQNLFVNHRYVRTRTASVALEEAFKGKLLTGRFPVCVLNVDIDYSQVDVNVHPAKIEVRFTEERAIYNAVYFAVKSAVSKTEEIPEAQSTVKKITPLSLTVEETEPEQERIDSSKTIPVYREEKEEKTFSKPLSFSTTKSPVKDSKGHRIVQPELFKKAMQSFQESAPVPETKAPTAIEEHKPLKETVDQPELKKQVEVRFIGELLNTYILLETEDEEFIMVDKHAAHERMHYEEIKNNSVAGNRQVLLSALPVTLNREEYAVLLENLETVETLGFLLEDFGTGTLIVRETPALLDGEDVSYLLSEIALKMLDGKRDLTPNVLDEIYFSIACKSAVRGGDRNHKSELMEIVNRLKRDPEISHCPHGRPVSVKFNKYEIEKMFGRQG